VTGGRAPADRNAKSPVARRTSSPSAVLFDADQTLLDFDRAQARALREAVPRVGLRFSPHLLRAYRVINDALWERFRQGAISGERLAHERFRQLLAHAGGDEQAAALLGCLFLDRLAQRGDRLPDCRRTLERLARRYRLGVVTNGYDRVQRSRLAAAGLTSFFEVVVTSEACRFAKPDPRILGVALAALGLPPRRALYVGDDPRTDAAAAAAARVPFVWLDRGLPLPAGTRRPRQRVASLTELAERLV